ncbi:WXG100 family type VII secretion target [Listeria costaricensis]|uniref:WXG100 family type VII secretion target n=1 Tax=Listeria costaricensis TaxID=2026604 RepID=UPI000C089370|nr:WXG100 family type VII secretion target [Listeria costaricensis]
MSKVKIDAGKVADAKTSAKQVEDSLEATHTKCKKLVKYVKDAKWKGKSRDAFLTYIELIEQYHEDVQKAYKKQRKALKNLDGYITDFKDGKEAEEVRRL